MKKLGFRGAGFVWLTSWAGACLAGCSGGDPLGGPYGGTTSLVGPNSENTQGCRDGGCPADVGQVGDALGESSVRDGQTEGGGDATVAIDAAGAPTWTYIYNQYLATCQRCHYQMMAAPSAYTWLRGLGYIDGTKSPLVSTQESVLSWYGGNMPPDGTANPQAVADMNAWAKVGAPYD